MSTTTPITRSSRRLDLDAAAGQTVFTLADVPVYDAADVAVFTRTAPDTAFVPVETGWTAALSGPAPATASVTFTTAPRPGAGDPQVTVRVQAARVQQRTSNVTRAGTIASALLEQDLDIQSTVLQELRRDINDANATLENVDAVANAAAEAVASATAAAAAASTASNTATAAAATAVTAADQATTVVAGAVQKAADLSDLASIPTARTNLGIEAQTFADTTTAAAATIPAGTKVLLVAGGSFIRAADGTAPDSFQSADGQWWASKSIALSGTDGVTSYTLAGQAFGGFNSYAFGYEIGTVDGTTPLNQTAFGVIRINDDQLDQTTDGPGSKVDGFQVLHYFGGSNARGGRQALEANLFLKNPTASDNPDRNYVGIVGQFVAQSDDGGSVGDVKGGGFGANFWAQLTAAATYWYNLTGFEINTMLDPASSVLYHSGFQISSSVGKRGTDVDAAISVSGNTLYTNLGFKDGILFGAQNGSNGLSSDSNVIHVKDQSVYRGIYFDGVFASSYIESQDLLLSRTSLTYKTSNSSVVLGSQSAANTPYIDFNSSGNNGAGYDARIIATGGGGGGSQNGTLVVRAGSFQSSGPITPEADNAVSCGNAAHRWSVVYAGTGTINTSDARTKRVRGSLSEAELAAWSECQPVVYQFLDAISEKGDKARLHAGLIAQDVQSAFERHGLDAWVYGLMCSDPVLATVKKTRPVERQKTERKSRVETAITVEMVDGKAVQKTAETTVEYNEPVFDEHPIIDEAGQPVVCTIPALRDKFGKVLVAEKVQQRVHRVPVMETIDEEYEVEEPTGDVRLGLRYTECLVMEAAYQRARADKIEARLTALEADSA